MQAAQYHHALSTKQTTELGASAVYGVMAHCTRPGSQGIELTSPLKYLLYKWFYRRFAQRTPTTELIRACDNAQDKIVIAIIAMLDVDAQSLQIGLNPAEWRFVQACHRYLQGLDWAR